MCPRRRSVLTAIGSLGIAGGAGGYWQRRRIRRRNDVEDFEATLDTSVPDVDESLTVTEAHVAESYDWTKDHLEETEATTGPDSRQGEIHIERAWELLEDTQPGQLRTNSDRVDALESYRLVVARSATTRGWYHEADDAPPSDELSVGVDRLESELDAFKNRYRGESLTKVTIQCAEADSLEATAASTHRRVTDRLRDADTASPTLWELVEVARARANDATLFARDRTGPERTDSLLTAFEELAPIAERDSDDFERLYADGIDSLAHTRWFDLNLGGTAADPASTLDAGRLALALREQAYRATVISTFDTLDGLPGRHELSKLDESYLDETTELVTAKKATAEELQTALDEVGVDPLGRYLLGEAVRHVDVADRSLERLLDDVRSADSATWSERSDSAYLRYREAAEDAKAVGDIVQTLHTV